MKCPHCLESLAYEPNLLTNRERDLFRYATRYQQTHKRPPTQREMKDALNYKSVTTVGHMLVSLLHKGYATHSDKGFAVSKKPEKKAVAKTRAKLKYGELKCPFCLSKIENRPCDLTAGEWAVYQYYVAFSHRHDKSPTLIDIMEAKDCVSNTSSRQQINSLIYRGYLIKLPGVCKYRIP